MRIKTTTSVCSECLERVPARVDIVDGEVWLRKRCRSHGEQRALLASDRSHYWEPARDDKVCGGCCMTAHSCTLIFEITERCNLTCPTCFTASSPKLGWRTSVDEFCEKLDRLLENGKHDADIVQLSGGEPTVHPELERIIEACFERGVRRVYLNTNGVRLASDAAFAERLAELGGERLQIYFQLDGFRERTHSLIRGSARLGEIKARAVDRALSAGLYVLPVMTVTRGINLDEVGAVIRFALERHPAMNSVILQPAFYAGRYENDRLERRLTVAELAAEVERQTGLFERRDFGPLPCSHPNCFALAVALMNSGKAIPVSRYFPRFDSWTQPDVAELIARAADKMPQTLLADYSEDETVERLLGLLSADDDGIDYSDYKSFFMVGIKPFMDAHSYDQDRVDRCCVHVVDRAGLPVSLCEYNVLRRPRGLS